MQSVSDRGMERISIWREQYILTINGTEYKAGLCLLKVIIRESYLDSNATVSSLRLQLSTLDQYIEENGSDIVEFNAHVRRLMDGLSARQATTQDLLVNLFKAYKKCNDKLFNQYIIDIENRHEDGTNTITEMELMNRTSNYYKKRMTNSTQKWEEDPEQRERDTKIQALQAQIQQLKKAGKSGTGKKGAKQPKSTKSDGKERPGWLANNTPPKNPTDTNTWKSTTYYWCDKSTGGKCGGKWRVHKPKECKGAAKRNSEGEEKSKESKKQKRDKALKMIAAQEAVLQELKDDDSSDSE
jgi:hypothetical protein